MNENDKNGFWQRLNLNGKLLIMAIIFAAIIAGQIGFSVMALQTQEFDTRHVDAVGRQRFLINRYYAEALQGALGAQGDQRPAREIFTNNLEALMTGGRIFLGTELDTGHTVVVPPVSGAAAERLAAARTLANRLFASVDRYLALSPDLRTADMLVEMSALRREVTSMVDAAAQALTLEFEADVDRAVRWAIIIGITACIVVLALAWLLGRSITRPLANLVAVTQAVAEGDLSPKPLPVRSRDEIGALTEAFNTMLVSLRRIAAETRSAADRLREEVAQIVSSVQEQASNTKEQAAAVQQITSTVEQISQSAQQVSGMAREVGDNAERVASSGHSGLQSALETTAAMEAIRSQTETIAENIVMLSERTQAVGEIIATVNEIAEQSNLVALNAAIEAADAGEQGRRFSVVANEIKALADQSKDATKQVRSILEQTQKGINTSVMLTEEALKRVVLGREKTATTEETIRQMAGSIQENAGSFQQVVAATGQQQIGLEQIAQGLHQIRQASLQMATSTDQLARSSASVGVLADALGSVIEKYRL